MEYRILAKCRWDDLVEKYGETDNPMSTLRPWMKDIILESGQIPSGYRNSAKKFTCVSTQEEMDKILSNAQPSPALVYRTDTVRHSSASFGPLVLKCEACGRKQIYKRHISKDFRWEVENASHIWCGCNECKDKNKDKRVCPKGMVEHTMLFNGGWTTILSPAVAARAERGENRGGSWSQITVPTIDELRSIQRAKAIARAGIEQLGKSK